MKRGMTKVLVYDRLEYELIATFNCWVFRFFRPPALKVDPVILADGRPMAVGARLTRAHGKKTSAGYSDFHLCDGNELRFAGTYTNLDGEILCFEFWQHGKRMGTPLEFHGFATMTPVSRDWVFSTPAVAGRIVETSRCEFIE